MTDILFANTFISERQMSYTNKTISNHIDYLAEVFLISKASRYDIKGRKYIGANRKYYFTDLGLRNARLNFRQQESTHPTTNPNNAPHHLFFVSRNAAIKSRTTKNHTIGFILPNPLVSL